MNAMRHRFALSALVLGVVLVAALPAGAATKTSLRCAVSLPLRITPGTSAEPRESYFSGRGTIACGAVGSAPALYTGTVSLWGSTAPSDTCSGGAGSGTFSASLSGPNASPLAVTARFTYVRTGLVMNGPVTMTGDDSGFGRLTTMLVPGAGKSCATAPMTRATLAGTLLLDGSFS